MSNVHENLAKKKVLFFRRNFYKEYIIDPDKSINLYIKLCNIEDSNVYLKKGIEELWPQ